MAVPMEDQELLALLQQQPEEGLWHLTEKYGALITTVVRRILPQSPQDAEECASDALVRIWKDAPRITLHGGTMRGFVIWAARTIAIDRYRQLRRSRQYILDGDDELLGFLPAPETDTAREAEQAGALRTAEELVRAMTPPDDEIFLRRFFLGETVPQIAGHLGMHSKAVESRLQRGKKKLREQLTERGVTLE